MTAAMYAAVALGAVYYFLDDLLPDNPTAVVRKFIRREPMRTADLLADRNGVTNAGKAERGLSGGGLNDMQCVHDVEGLRGLYADYKDKQPLSTNLPGQTVPTGALGLWQQMVSSQKGAVIQSKSGTLLGVDVGAGFRRVFL